MKTRKAPTLKRKPALPANPSRTAVIFTSLLIGVAVLIVYSQTFGYGFVSFDDGAYVYQNAMVKAGLSLRGLAWAFTTFYASNWHPFTWISYMLAAELFGVNAGEQHAVNVFIHLSSSILLFLALDRMTKNRWRSALVAGIFSVHPLHVESVAWIAERKDVLSTFFEILTIWLYVRYTEEPKLRRYALVAAAFACSLLSKPTAVTLPFVFLLLDIWPLRRRPALLEKTPLFAMSAAASVVTVFAQRNTGAMMTLSRLPFADRIANAVVAYVRYIEKAFWPVNLAVLYPIEKYSPMVVFTSAAVLMAITIAALAVFRGRPYVLVGWLWFTGMLVPVIGLVQVGFQSMADRYMYLPLVGLSIAVIWAAGDLIETNPHLRQTAAAAAAFAMIALAVAAYRQTEYWKDSITLFEHTLAVTNGNAIIHNNLGIDLQAAGRLDEAAAQFRLAVAAAPDNKDALNSLGAILEYKGNKAEAIALHRRAIAADPNYAGAHFNLGHELMETGQTEEALSELTRGLQLQPGSARGHAYLGALFLTTGNLEAAKQHLLESVRLAPDNAEAQSNLCYVLQALGDPSEAIGACDAALKIRPNLASAQLNLARARAALVNPQRSNGH